jgi:outer membrane protein TolC
VNPAYAGLNQILGQAAYPTHIQAMLPLARETKLVATQPLFAPALLFQHRLRGDELAAERASWAAFARQLRAEVQTAYFEYGRASQTVALLDRTRALLDENLRVSELLLRNGKLTEDAVFRARADLAELAQRRDEVEGGVDAARRFLNFLVDRPLGDPVPEPPPPVSPLGAGATTAVPITAASALAASARREELARLAAGQRAAADGARLAGSAYLPTVALAAEYGFQGDRYDFGLDRDYLVASLVLRWNLWAGLGDRARVRQAELASRRLDLQEAEVRRQIALEVLQAWRSAETSRRAISTTAERVASARASYEVVSRKFAAGAAPPVELLDARTTLTRAEVDQVSSTYEFAIRLVELERVAALAPETNP